MSEKILAFYQIYYKEEQLSHLYDFATPYFNNRLTPFFENSVIKSLVSSSTADLISICSWKLKQKRKSLPSVTVLKENESKFNKEIILSSNFDVAILTPRNADHQTLSMARNWHGQVWTDSFTVLTAFLKKELKIAIPQELSYPIYENHFIAKGQIYRNYVSSCLIPVLEFMEKTNMGSVRSGYRKHKERLGDIDSIKDYERSTGLTDWPIGVFLLERLFSIWIDGKSFNVINL